MENRPSLLAAKKEGIGDRGLGARDRCSNISSTTELNSGTTNIFQSLPSATDNALQPPAPLSFILVYHIIEIWMNIL